MDEMNRRPPRVGEPMIKRENQPPRLIAEDLDKLLEQMEVRIDERIGSRIDALSHSVEDLSQVAEDVAEEERGWRRWQVLMTTLGLSLTFAVAVAVWAEKNGRLPEQVPEEVRWLLHVVGGN